MNLIYENSLGSSYNLKKGVHSKSNLQLVVGTVGIFMTKIEISDLLKIVRNSHEPCDCIQCKGQQCNKIWTTSPFVDICIKVNEETLELLEDLIVGTQFCLNMDATLNHYEIK